MLSRILGRWKAFRSIPPDESGPSDENIRGWTERILDRTDIIRILPACYGRNRSFRIELNNPPYKAILKTYRSAFAHDRQRNEAASMEYLAPFFKGTVPEVYGAASNEEDTPWIL